MGRGMRCPRRQVVERHHIMRGPIERMVFPPASVILTELSMRIVITGGAGFLGNRLACALLARDVLTNAHGEVRRVSALILIDNVPASFPDPRVTVITGDLADPAVMERGVTSDTDSVFHLAAVVSGQAEAEFDV